MPSPTLLGVLALQVLTVIAMIWYLGRRPRIRQRLLDSLRALLVFVLGLSLWAGLYFWWHPTELKQIVGDLRGWLAGASKSD